MIDAHLHDVRRHGEVKHSAAGNSELLVDRLQPGLELGISARVVKTAIDVKEGTREIRPVIFVGWTSGKSGSAVLGALANPFIGIAFSAQAKTDHGKIGGQYAVDV